MAHIQCTMAAEPWYDDPVFNNSRYFCVVYDYAGKKRLRQELLKSKEKIGGSLAFFRGN